MLRIIPNTSSAGAAKYFTKADYYTEGQELTGYWLGEGAARLGLAGEITEKSWEALCYNRDPHTGEFIKPRQKSDRTVGYDMSFHVPKSVSILYSISQDDRILDAFRDAVGETMMDIESEMMTRVRKGGKNTERTTGSMVWGEFVHTTSRPIDGVPDPLLHAHCFVLNTTWDPVELRWKAGQFREIKRDAPYFQAAFHTRLSRNLQELSYSINKNAKSWEVAGVSPELVRKFSRRTIQIEALAEALNITDPDEKAKLGAKTREKKQTQLSPSALRDQWLDRLTPDEKESLARAVPPKQTPEPHRDLQTLQAEKVSVLHRSILHCFERESVVPERVFLADVLRRGVGLITPEETGQLLRSHGVLVHVKDGRRFVTTRAIVEEERELLDYARQGRGACRPLGTGSWQWNRSWLNHEQKNAVRHVLESTDRVMLIRGVAGTGKTSLMKEAVEAIEANGKRVFTYAPSADASRGVLRSKGFADATTVAELLVNKEQQANLKGQVIWVDEASLLGTRTMGQVFALAKQNDCRVILSGDRKQHKSVSRGDSLRLLEQEAGLVPAEVREIQRQKGKYKAAVKLLSEGHSLEAFNQLDAMGWVHELPDDNRDAMLAHDYVQTLKAGRSVLVVSPTHAEGKKVTEAIRAELKTSGVLKQKDVIVPMLINSQLTEGERADATSYHSGDILVFHQNAKGFKRGQRVVVTDPNQVPLQLASRYQVFRQTELPIAVGDTLRITHNGFTKDKQHSLNNGATYHLKSINRDGDLVLDNGWVVAGDYGFLSHGYVVTSFAAQGKSIDRVLIAESSKSFPAVSREQAYVSISRGEQDSAIYTDSKEALRERIQHTTEHLTATELFKQPSRKSKLEKHLSHLKRLTLQNWFKSGLTKAQIRAMKEQQRERKELAYG